MTQEEKTLILGALFHDIGKFEQRCNGNPSKKFHYILGRELIESGQFIDKFQKIVGKENIDLLKDIIADHHKGNPDGLTKIVQIADHISASARVEKEEVEVYKDQWTHKHLASLFSKIQLMNDNEIQPRYYKHKLLTKNEYDVIIPSDMEENEIKEYAYSESVWNNFLEDLYYVLDVYNNEDDFDSLINLLLIIFEKYMWCIPDFTGSSQTDISLYNHLKDVASFAHSIYLSKAVDSNSQELNLIIGDIPGIQSYIFDVINKKPAKILRGRSIFVQVLTRAIATKFLKAFSLTETNLIMFAGGKFYILAPSLIKGEKFENIFNQVRKEIDEFLFENFRMELSFNCAFYSFDYEALKNNSITFGTIIEQALQKLLENRYLLFQGTETMENYNFVLDEKYINDDGSGTDSIKCKVTDKPIRFQRKAEIQIPSDEGMEFLTVDKQVKIEYEIGSKIVGDNLILVLEDDGLTINPDNIFPVQKYEDNPNLKRNIKILLNPTLNKLLKEINPGKKDVFRNTYYLEVANYCSKSEKESVMPFEDIVENNAGAKFLSLIKGDIDNLGLIMAYGLYRNQKDPNLELKSDSTDLNAVSRTTTMSNHLKYFYSFFLNGFLKEWEKQNQKENEKGINENRVYTVFAGGDDLMLVTPQSSALKLVKALNCKFSEFVCNNDEVHISYSLTYFKDHTPFKIVSKFAEENQKEGKSSTTDSQYALLLKKDKKAFCSANDKAGTYLFDTYVKNNNLDYLLKEIDFLTSKAIDTKSGLSQGLIRRLYELSDMLREYEKTNDANYLIAVARLNYTVNRLLKDKDLEIKEFFENVLSINKEKNEEAKNIELILRPLVCQVIYNLRNK